MTEIEGDIVKPYELIVPWGDEHDRTGQQTISGAMFISGSTLYFVDSSGTMRTVTST